MSDIYIEDFNRDVAMILHRLYNFFPKPSAIYIDEIAGIDDPDEFGVASERHQRCMGAMMWLAEEGLIRFRDTIGIEGLDAAVLTLRGYRVLHAPDIHSQQPMMIYALREALRERDSEAVKRCINRLFELVH